MGLSNILPGGESPAPPAAGGTVPASGTAAPAHQDFGQRLGGYFENKYPVAGGLASAVFGNTPPSAQPATAPLAGMPSPEAQPMLPAPDLKSGGLSALLKLFA